MKRYKQTFLSEFFITRNSDGELHLVEANLDIESRSDRALCTEVLSSPCEPMQVLENHHLPRICPICRAILLRRESNLPSLKPVFTRLEKAALPCVSDDQLSLLDGDVSTAQMELFTG